MGLAFFSSLPSPLLVVVVVVERVAVGGEVTVVDDVGLGVVSVSATMRGVGVGDGLTVARGLFASCAVAAIVVVVAVVVGLDDGVVVVGTS